MIINKLLTTVNYKNTNDLKRIKYIVVHYVGATGGAEENCKYFKSVYRGASAHYFIGHKGEVWQSVEDADTAWHCGALKYKHSGCRNSNSIGIELCCKKDKGGNWYFEDATVNSAIELVRELMKKYNIPKENVLRHYDITGKVCPEPFVRNAAAWDAFKNKLTTGIVASSFLVKINTDVLNVRAGAGTAYKVNRTVKRGEVYTIVDEVGGWGKLKSGAGWISLAYTKRL